MGSTFIPYFAVKAFVAAATEGGLEPVYQTTVPSLLA
jgi:hypothetical protein